MEAGITKECRFRRCDNISLGGGNLEYHSCFLAAEGVMVHQAQCDECGVEELLSSFDCRHMRPQKRFLSGGESEECISCAAKGSVLDKRRSACVACPEKE
jgi:hypothetical protein